MPNASTHLCNATGASLAVWLEPWAQEFELPPRSVLDLHCESNDGSDPTPDIEIDEEIVTVWATGGSRIAVFIDGVDQDSFSGHYAAPDMGVLSTRGFVQLVFSGFPEARPGGLPLPSVSAWGRLKSFVTSLVKRGT